MLECSEILSTSRVLFCAFSYLVFTFLIHSLLLEVIRFSSSSFDKTTNLGSHCFLNTSFKFLSVAFDCFLSWDLIFSSFSSFLLKLPLPLTTKWEVFFHHHCIWLLHESFALPMGRLLFFEMRLIGFGKLRYRRTLFFVQWFIGSFARVFSVSLLDVSVFMKS